MAVNFTFFPAESLLDGAVTVILATFCGAAVVGCVGVGFGASGFEFSGFVGSAGASVAFAVTETVITFAAFLSVL